MTRSPDRASPARSSLHRLDEPKPEPKVSSERVVETGQEVARDTRRLLAEAKAGLMNYAFGPGSAMVHRLASALAAAEQAQRLAEQERDMVVEARAWRPDREAVARIIDPTGLFSAKEAEDFPHSFEIYEPLRKRALAKADEILALAEPPASTLSALSGEEDQDLMASIAGLPAHVADATATDTPHSAGKED